MPVVLVRRQAARGRLDTSVTSANNTIQELEGLRTAIDNEEVAEWGVEEEVGELKAKVKRMKVSFTSEVLLLQLLGQTR